MSIDHDLDGRMFVYAVVAEFDDGSIDPWMVTSDQAYARRCYLAPPPALAGRYNPARAAAALWRYRLGLPGHTEIQRRNVSHEEANP